MDQERREGLTDPLDPDVLERLPPWARTLLELKRRAKENEGKEEDGRKPPPADPGGGRGPG